MIFGLFRGKRNASVIGRLHADIVAAARDPVLFTDYGIADTIDGRFESIALHAGAGAAASEAIAAARTRNCAGSCRCHLSPFRHRLTRNGHQRHRRPAADARSCRGTFGPRKRLQRSAHAAGHGAAYGLGCGSLAQCPSPMREAASALLATLSDAMKPWRKCHSQIFSRTYIWGRSRCERP